MTRRNVIVHSNNFPDRAYLNLVKTPKTYPAGSLFIDLDYLDDVLDALAKCARKVVQQLVDNGTFDPSELDESSEESQLHLCPTGADGLQSDGGTDS